jgi:CheY-like chemotaxis protein
VAFTILLADDSVPAQNTGRKILTEAGYDVVTASNGLEALRKLNEASPALAILDIFMPGYTGFEICEKLRSVPATAALPVVLSVGKMEPFREEDATKVGANGTLAKPFVAEQMLAVIRGLLGEPVVETKPVQPLQPPPPAPTAEDEPMFAYAALGQELRDKGEGFQNPSTVEPQAGADVFRFNPDAMPTPFSASSADLAPESPLELESPLETAGAAAPAESAPDQSAHEEKAKADSQLEKDSEDSSFGGSGLDPLLETKHTPAPPSILESTVLDVGDLPEKLTDPTLEQEPEPAAEEHLSAEEEARRKAFEELFNSDQLPPVEEPLALQNFEPLDLMPNLSTRSVGYEPHIEADPELEHTDPTRQPEVHLETTADPYLEEHAIDVDDILSQVAPGAGRDVYLEDAEGSSPFVSGAQMEVMSSAGAPVESAPPEVTHDAKPEAAEEHEPLEAAAAAEVAKPAPEAHAEPKGNLTHDLLMKATEAFEEHAGHSPLATTAAGLAGGAGVAAAVPMLEHLVEGFVHHEAPKPEATATMPAPEKAEPEARSPLEEAIHGMDEPAAVAEAASAAESSRESLPGHQAETHAEETPTEEAARPPLATDGPLAAVFELARQDFSGQSKTHASTPLEADETSPLEHEGEEAEHKAAAGFTAPLVAMDSTLVAALSAMGGVAVTHAAEAAAPVQEHEAAVEEHEALTETEPATPEAAHAEVVPVDAAQASATPVEESPLAEEPSPLQTTSVAEEGLAEEGHSASAHEDVAAGHELAPEAVEAEGVATVAEAGVGESVGENDVADEGHAEDDIADEGPSVVHSIEQQHLQAAVEKVFERFKPLLVAAIVRELARRD